MNRGVSAQPHHVAPSRVRLKSVEQLVTGESSIRQYHDRVDPLEQGGDPLQQGNYHLSAAPVIVMLMRLSEQKSYLTEHGEGHDAKAVPDHLGFKC